MHDLGKTEIVIANYLHQYSLFLESTRPPRDEQGNCSVCATGVECGGCQVIQDLDYLAGMLKSGELVVTQVSKKTAGIHHQMVRFDFNKKEG